MLIWSDYLDDNRLSLQADKEKNGNNTDDRSEIEEKLPELVQKTSLISNDQKSGNRQSSYPAVKKLNDPLYQNQISRNAPLHPVDFAFARAQHQ